MALATVSVLIVVPMGSYFVHFDEGFVARANRTREERGRLLEILGAVATPRWGLSLGGIALIILALGWFGAEPVFAVSHMHGVPLFAGASAGLVFAFALIAGAGWREAIAGSVVCVATGLMALWGFAAEGAVTQTALACIVETLAIVALLIFYGAARTHDCRKRGEDGARAVEETGTAQFFAALGALMALLPALFFQRNAAAFGIALFFAGCGALVFAPALAAAIAALLPRRRSVEELYGRG